MGLWEIAATIDPNTSIDVMRSGGLRESILTRAEGAVHYLMAAVA
jgi:hypothetical protein